MPRFLRKILALLLVPLLPALLAGTLHPKRPRLNPEAVTAGEIALPDALALREKGLWLDARPRPDFDSAHIPGAIRLTQDDWDRLLEPVLDQWSSDRVIVVYCSSTSCHASHEVAARLRDEVGLKPVYVLKGGWEAWTEWNH